ncbi:actin-related protein 10 [Cydia splendana]|uniref:actin-related protein 10 n=1 Tax=Cydia splendana TaxID=1100963 RepID=UPI0021270E63
MALYEGIALIQEKQAVVLDLGSEYTKFGFTGEAAPRCIIRSQFWSPELRRFKRVYDYANEDELYDNLVHMLHLLYFRHVLVNPKERRVVVAESLLTPTAFRETLAKVLFTHYEVSGVAWADTPRLCALTLGAPIVLVVEIGAREAEVCAVVHGSVVLKALQTAPLGALAVRAELARILDEDNKTELNLDPTVLEDIAVKTCLVTTRDRAVQWASDSPPTPAKSVRYPLPSGGAVTVSGRARELSAEPLFLRDNEYSSLPDLLLQCIMQCPIDVRRALADNILVCGGGAALPGLRARLKAELQHALTEPVYNERLHLTSLKFHTAPSHWNCVAWLGGALLLAGAGAGAGAGEAARAAPREAFLRERRLRDWVCLLDNTPPHHPAREHHQI